MEYEFTVSIDIDSCIIAENEEEALEQANEQIRQGYYSVMIVDKQPLD